MLQATCHCGAVTIEVARAPAELTSCNCSICRRLGTLWAYYNPSEVQVRSEPDATAAYIWGDRTIALHHCRTCGCVTHWSSLDPEQTTRMGVHARLLGPEDIAGVRVRRFDGADTWRFLD